MITDALFGPRAHICTKWCNAAEHCEKMVLSDPTTTETVAMAQLGAKCKYRYDVQVTRVEQYDIFWWMAWWPR
jgi:hypothetical protein